MENTNIENIINNSFLARVPEFLAKGLSMDEALKAALDADNKFAIEMMNGETDRAKKATEILCNQVYTKAKIEGAKAEGAQRMENIFQGWHWQQGRDSLDSYGFYGTEVR